MVDPKKKGKYIGMVGALLVHVAFILLLILVGFVLPEQQDEDGMPVMLGEVPNAFGSADPSLVKVDVMPETVAPKVQETVEQEMLTQEDEETVVIKPKAEPKKEEVKKKPAISHCWAIRTPSIPAIMPRRCWRHSRISIRDGIISSSSIVRSSPVSAPSPGSRILRRCISPMFHERSWWRASR